MYITGEELNSLINTYFTDPGQFQSFYTYDNDVNNKI